MKVWILTEDFPPKRGGISRWAWSTASTLSRLDSDVTVFAKRPRSPDCPGMRVIPVEGRSFCALRHIHFARSLRRELGSSPAPDVVLASTWRTAEGAMMARVPCPVHVAVHGLEVFARYTILLRMRRRLVLGKADRVIAASRFTAEQASKIIPGARVSTGLNGVDIRLFSPGGPSAPKPNAFQILSAGRLVPRKRFDLVIDLVARLRADGVDAGAWIVGTGPERESLREKASPLGGAVLFRGDVDDTELIGLYRGADLFASPCMSDPASGDVEGFGITFIEASACGLATAGLAEGGVVDAVESGVTGILSSRNGFIGEASSLCSAPGLLASMGRAGRERTVRLFDLEKVVPSMLEPHGRPNDPECTSVGRWQT